MEALSPWRDGLSEVGKGPFLRRHLPPEVYDAVRAYEQCIVVSDSEKHIVQVVPLTCHRTQELGFFICLPQAAFKSLS